MRRLLLALLLMAALTPIAVGFVLHVWRSLRRLRAEEPFRGGGPGAAVLRKAGPWPEPLFRLESVSKSYRDAAGETVVVLDRVHLELFDREVTAVLGPSGQGKTTMLNLIGGLDVPDEGTISFRGRPLPAAEGAELRRFRAERVCYVFQDLSLISHLPAEENAALPLLLRGVPPCEALAAARASLKALGMGRYARRRPAQLSGGQRQRVAIARAFTADVDVILADEPSGSLDPVNAQRVMRAFRQLSRLHRKPVVLVTHNVALARAYCDRLLVCTARGFKDVTRAVQAGQRVPPARGANSSRSTEGSR